MMVSIISLTCSFSIVAATVATNHGAKVARWRTILFMVTLGFIFGGSVFFGVVADYYEKLFVEIKIPSVKIEVLSGLILVVLLLLGWLVVGLIIASSFRFPTPMTLITVVGLVVGFRMVGVEVSFQPIINLFMVHLVTIIMSSGAAAVSYIIIAKLLDVEDPLTSTLASLPYLFIIVLPIHCALFLCAAIKLFGDIDQLSLYFLGSGMFMISAGITLLFVRLLVVNKTKRHVFELLPQHYLEYVPTGEERLAERGMVVGRDSPTPTISKLSTNSILNRQRAEESFVYILLTISTLSSSVQGVIDIGTIVGLARIFTHLLKKQELRLTFGYWVIAVSVMFGITGIIGLGNRFTRRLSHDLTNIYPSMALSIELGCFLPILCMTFYGIPVSSIIYKLPTFLIVSYLSRQGTQKKAAISISLAIIGSLIIMLATWSCIAYLGFLLSTAF